MDKYYIVFTQKLPDVSEKQDGTIKTRRFNIIVNYHQHVYQTEHKQVS